MNDVQKTAWSRVHSSARTALEDGAKVMADALGNSIVALTFYGEAMSGAASLESSPIRSVLVVSQVELAPLRRLAEQGLRLGKAGLAAPIVVTLKYIQDSLDTFPLEWLEIQQQGVTVIGHNPFAELSFEAANVRLQCERELKRILMGMRQGLLAATGKERAVSLLERDAAETLLRTLRGVLWLKGRREHLPTAVVLEEIEHVLGAKLSGVRDALSETSPHNWSEFDRLYADVETLMGKADAL